MVKPLPYFIAALFLASASLASAGTPTKAYLANRDKAVAALSGPEYNDKIAEKERLALEALDPMIRSLVGPIHIPGFISPGKPNVDQVSGSMGFGKLDGMLLASEDGKAFMIVSTVPLLEAWTRATKPDHPDPFRQPSDFITGAVANDAHAEVVTRISVAAHSQEDRVGAVLMLFAQDLGGAYLPNKVAVTVVHGGRMFLVVEEVVALPIPECAGAFEREDAAAKSITERRHDSAALRRFGAMQQAAIDRYGACLTSHAAAQPWFRRVAERSQALVDLVSGKTD